MKPFWRSAEPLRGLAEPSRCFLRVRVFSRTLWRILAKGSRFCAFFRTLLRILGEGPSGIQKSRKKSGVKEMPFPCVRSFVKIDFLVAGALEHFWRALGGRGFEILRVFSNPLAHFGKGFEILRVFSNPLAHFGKRFVILHIFSDPLAAGHNVEPPVRADSLSGRSRTAHFGKRFMILHIFSDPLAAGHNVEPLVEGRRLRILSVFSSFLPLTQFDRGILSNPLVWTPRRVDDQATV